MRQRGANGDTPASASVPPWLRYRPGDPAEAAEEQLGPDAERVRPDAPPGEDEFRVDAPAVSLPKGGGAIRGIDEQFRVNPANGTAALGIPLPFSPGRNGVTPPVRMAYDSGSGNSVLGLGWSLDFPSVRRRTDKAIPTYTGEDQFLWGGAELVPARRWDGGAWVDEVARRGPLTITRYRPRLESQFARIEHVRDDAGPSWWRVTTRDNVTTFFGASAATRLTDPAAGHRVFEWLPELTFDDQGNCIAYTFVAEDLAGVPASLSEGNRRRGLAPFTNRYLKRVRYGNRTPYAPDAGQPFTPAALPAQFLFELVFDFGDHDAGHPTPDPAPGAVWPARPDPFSSYRQGFEVRTYRLVRRVLMFHRFDELDGGRPCLVRSLDLAHTPTGPAGPGAPGPAEATLLTAATTSGYLLHDGVYAKDSLPPMTFSYEPLRWDDRVRSVGRSAAEHLPAGATGPYQFADLFSEGIPGIFSEQAEAWFYKANLGDADEDGQVRFDASRLVAPKPSFTGMQAGALQLQDLDADGRKQVVSRAPGLEGYFELGADGEWRPFEAIPGALRIELSGPHLRMLDLVGDGRADVLVLGQDELVWHRSEGRRGFQPARRAPRPADEEHGPAVVFSDGVQAVVLADMSGDGLTDIVRIRNGEVCYWPNLGYGRFGAKVAMDGAPVFDHADHYRSQAVHLADVTGTGATDIVYAGRDACTVYVNLGGNAWSAGRRVPHPFPPTSPVRLSTTDLLGNGTACLVWSSPLPADAAAPMRYVDLTGGRKPHLLSGYANNLGKEVTLSYKASTWHYLRDKEAGRPWLTTLPFPVHCVRAVEARDRVRGTRLVSEYRYHHGHYDRAERSFAGFGMVEQLDAEQVEHWATGAGGVLVDRTVDQPPVLTRTWFHTGAHDDRPGVLGRYRDEHWDAELRRHGFAVTAAEPVLPDARIVAAPGTPADAAERPTPEHRRQALWACRGLTLRQEVFALDAPAAAPTDDERRRQLSPYTVASTTCLVELLQPANGDEAAVFVVLESEALSFHYERDLADPRVEHTLNVRVDELGNVTESARVVYGRAVADPSLPDAVRQAQARTWVTYTSTEFTGDAVDDVNYRLRQQSRSSVYEVRGVPRAGALHTVADFDRPGFHVLTGSAERPHHDREADPPGGVVWRRLVSRAESLFYDGDAATPLPLHALHFRALAYESYQLAFTPELVAHVYGARVTAALLAEGRYVQRDGGWWVASGRNVHVGPAESVADAQARFFVPVAHVDGAGVRTRVGYFGTYNLLPSETEDAAGNLSRATAFDLRALAPVRMVDPNDNLTEVVLDELGRVKAAAVLGKGGEGDDLTGLVGWATPADAAGVAAFAAAATSTALADAGRALLQRATARYVYDVNRFALSGGSQPAGVATIVREQHAAVDVNAPVHVSFQYSNGSGAVELQKVPAEPGEAKQATVDAGGTVTVTAVDTRALVPPQLRWLGTGRKVVNNKGNVVKQYEPFFSVTHRFENHRELVESGVTDVHLYDPVGRRVRTDFPDGTFSRTVQLPWRVEEHDRSDTVLESAWHDRRVRRLVDAELTAAGMDPAREEQAARRSEPHAGTPFTRHVDALGNPLADVLHNGLDAGGNPALVTMRYRVDVAGRTLAVVDPRGHVTVTYEYDLRGTMAAHASADGGRRWMLDDARGEPVRAWDERGHEFAFFYDDPLRRPTAKRVRGGDGPAPLDHVFERTVYGEGRPGDRASNLRGQIAVLYDTAGRVENHRFDFKGNLLSSTRRLAADYRAVPHWAGPNPDAALEAEAFTTTTVYDGLDRIARRTTPDGSVYRATFNPANLVDTVEVAQDGDTVVLLSSVDYDEQGRRRRVVSGNGVVTTYDYDRLTSRLVRVRSAVPAGTLLQDLHHTYDASGNLVFREDRCIPTVWFANAMVTGLATFRYDALYRLVEATGREHAGQAFTGGGENWDDAGFRTRVAPGDALAWRSYTQAYGYDEAGNLRRVGHTAAGGDWVRTYRYGATSNRLESTTVAGTTFAYGHDAHGHVDAMPHLSVMRWNFRGELAAVATQVVAAGVPETTFYVYDGQGRRVRKVTDRASAGATGTRRSERLYLGGVELHRQYDGAGNATSEHQTLEVRDDRQQVALVERDRPAGGPVGPRLVRYQTANHLASATLETDETGRVVSYEEYHPFGTTAYQAVDRTVSAAAKRYRYTGMERDEESGFSHHGARYYAPWLGRWTAPDTHPEKLDGNRYAYVRNNPLAYADSNGRYEELVHGALTYRLALAAGFTWEEAAEIALADAGMDHDPDTRPGDDIGEMQAQIWRGRTHRYHYPSPEQAEADLDRDITDIGTGEGDLARFGRHLHSFQDVGTRERPGPHNRGSVRILTPAVFAVGLGVGGLGALAAWGASAALSSSSTAWNVVGVILAAVAAALFAVALYAILFSIVATDIGHPSYATERSRTVPDAERSHSFRHAADHAFADPVATTHQHLLDVFPVLQRAAAARGHVRSSKAQAEAAITKAVEADTEDEITDYLTEELTDVHGNRVPSYAEIRRRAPWRDRGIDITLDKDRPYCPPIRGLRHPDCPPLPR